MGPALDTGLPVAAFDAADPPRGRPAALLIDADEDLAVPPALVVGEPLHASGFALVERLGEPKLATLDHRHFSVLRPAHVAALELLPS